MNTFPNIEYDYDPETRILHKTHTGDISKNDIFGSWDYAIENKLIKNDIAGIVIDYRKARLSLELRDTDTIPQYFDRRPDIFGGKKLAVIVNTPNEIVYPLLIEQKEKTYILKTFSTEEAATVWILNNVPVLS